MSSADDPMTPDHARRTRRNRISALAAIAIAAIAFVVITAGGIGQNIVYYWGPTEIREAGEKAIGATIRLGGQVEPGSIRHTAAALEFRVTDGKSAVDVKSTGVPPQMFREGIGVVMEGTMTPGGFFTSERLMVSHDNEYRVPDDPANTDTRKLIESAEGI